MIITLLNVSVYTLLYNSNYTKLLYNRNIIACQKASSKLFLSSTDNELNIKRIYKNNKKIYV